MFQKIYLISLLRGHSEKNFFIWRPVIIGKLKVVVLGSNSFSGADFIDLLLERGVYSVTGVSRSPEKGECFLPYKRRSNIDFRFHQMDFNNDMDRIIDLLNSIQPEYVVNFAAQSEVGPSWNFPEQWFQTNAVAITQLINALKEKKYLKRYVHISSPEVYGTCEGVVREDAPMNPSTPYAASKAAGDFSIFTYVKNFNFPMVMIRATNVYGAYQQLFKIIPRSVIYLRQRKMIELHGEGKAIKSYIHIRDVSYGELLAMEKGIDGKIYHLSPKEGVAIRSLVALICQKMGQDFEKVTRSVEERLGQDKIYSIDSSRAEKELGWSPKISIERGLDEVIRWVEDNWEDLKNQPLDYIHKP
jgi:dTDP-glucose 4,6-dehydratase